jgi:hypothetical protein
MLSYVFFCIFNLFFFLRLKKKKGAIMCGMKFYSKDVQIGNELKGDSVLMCHNKGFTGLLNYIVVA